MATPPCKVYLVCATRLRRHQFPMGLLLSSSRLQRGGQQLQRCCQNAPLQLTRSLNPTREKYSVHGLQYCDRWEFGCTTVHRFRQLRRVTCVPILTLSHGFYPAYVIRVERICREARPELSGKIVVLAEREVIRQVTNKGVFSWQHKNA